ncbi:rho GTPase-activating protein 19-like isoform X2 [Mercenaria mercenaria]|nr:rho GTPase-activating protein 19-like isoform X2 [Mercenaria mercenaria]XP_053407004.1 rho GTPase-activating protein 19-like isoform X2 [Mercenaria mercenaria]XP_053407005.1 rho GTPase-activating protein 19-like isoform X2 [Mercenaria mercenaria]XP_053407006.1 rho GTPase-activating protein 19-like isoform X2 [Mercenaria mercenaria]XP_053407007.1 rho GTPase-activating protein 19-like isoform X2 [Mercenaria mercenaria]XP_053407008.1 rho GTPase-activating protein 19-like isoform X2 [Mercenaria
MSAPDVRRSQTEAEKNVNRLRNCMPEKLMTFCKMHLSFLLELDGSKLEEMFMESSSVDCNANKKKNATPFSTKKKDRTSGPVTAPLSKEVVSCMYKLISYLQKTENLKTEGLFRKTGNVTRQRLLKEWIHQGAELNLNDGTFSPHDVATVLKQLLSDLPEPLLTQKHFEAHQQIVDMCRHCQSEKEKARAGEKQLKALQLLMLLLPRENAILLECLFDLLHKAAHVSENKMSTSSLGVVFAPSLLCPRKLTPEEMHSVSPVLSKVVATMIEKAPSLFAVPRELGDDVANFWREMEDPNVDVFTCDKENVDDHANIQKAKYGSSSAVNTVLTFAERKSPEEFDSAQDTQVALAQLYAHVQAMPESAKKKKLLKQFNRASGVQPNSTKKGKHSRSRTFGESLKKHFPILSRHKSRDVCESEDSDVTWSITKPIMVDDSIANISYMKTPDNRYTPVLRHSPAVHVVDLGASPCNVKPKKRLSDENIDSQVKNSKIPHMDASASYLRPATPKKTLFPSTPAVQRPVAMVSPITQSVTKMPELTKKAIMTPRSRLPMLVLQSPNKSYTESVL